MANFDNTLSSYLIGTTGDDNFFLTIASIYSTTVVTAGAGNDFIQLEESPMINQYDIHGEAGVDTLSFAARSSAISISLASNFLYLSGSATLGYTGIENVYGTTYADSLTGDGGNNLFRGGDGADTLTGGAGIDTVDYSDSSAGVIVDIGMNIVSGGTAAGDILSGFERVIGSAYNDLLSGSDGRNVLRGGAGQDNIMGHGGTDVLRGMQGADVLAGGGGGDHLFGGLGTDSFRYDALSDSGVYTHRDTIEDFQAGDIIDLVSIDADPSTFADDAFHLSGQWFDGTAGAIRFGASQTGLTLLADIDGDRHIDFTIDVTGVSSLQASDFWL